MGAPNQPFIEEGRTSAHTALLNSSWGMALKMLQVVRLESSWLKSCGMQTTVSWGSVAICFRHRRTIREVASSAT
jgi:hypothetical protein